MTFVALALLGVGLTFVASALADQTLQQTLGQFLSGDTSAFSAQQTDSTGTVVTPGVFSRTVFGGTASEGGPAALLGTAWNYCVETAGQLLAQASGHGQATAQNIASAAQDMVAHGWATGGGPQDYGKSNFSGEQQELAKQGFQTKIVDLHGLSVQGLQQAITPYLAAGKPVALGNDNAQALYDQIHQKTWDTGVKGHAIVIEGFDSGGVLAADPNSPPPGIVAYYSWQSLAASQPSQLLVPA